MFKHLDQDCFADAFKIVYAGVRFLFWLHSEILSDSHWTKCPAIIINEKKRPIIHSTLLA